jgi:hypothetical protein
MVPSRSVSDRHDFLRIDVAPFGSNRQGDDAKGDNQQAHKANSIVAQVIGAFTDYMQPRGQRGAMAGV